MKKNILSAVTALTLSAALLAGCSGTPAPTTAPTTTPTATPAPVETPAPTMAPIAEGALGTGLYITGGQSKSKDATAEKDGSLQTDATVFAVTVDANGVIQACIIDAIQGKAAFDATGVVTTELPAAVLSKNELGDEYGMRGASSISAEWNEQAAAFAAYAVGKTVEDLKGIAVNEKGAPADADLAAGCTLAIGSWVEGIEAAVYAAADLGAKPGDKLSLASLTTVSAGKKEGSVAMNADISAVTTDAEGRLTSCVIDILQSSFTVDATGVITSDTSAALLSKNALGDAYGMRGASSINAEWNEQAAAFAAFCAGKTADEINGLTVTEDGKTDDADLLAGCTLPIGGFQAVVTKAMG